MDHRDADRSTPPAVPDDPIGAPVPAADAGPLTERDAVAAALEGLPITGFTRRRVAFAIAVLVTAWIVIVFTRQIGEASAATARAADMSVANSALQEHVAALQRELELIQTDPYIRQQARAYQLGSKGEIPFELAPDAPPLAANAPGSAQERIGEPTVSRSPLDAWLTLLFGSGSTD